MHTKKISAQVFFFLAVLVGLTVPGRAALTLGDGSELFLKGTVGFQYDDNVFLRHTGAKSDYITTFTPGVELQFGQNSLAKGSFIYNEAIAKYSSHSSQDSNLANISFNVAYDDGAKTKGSLAASYSEQSQNTIDARLAAVLVRQNVTTVNGKGEWGMSEKTSFGAGANYENHDYKTVGFVTYDRFTVPLDFYYKMEPKLDVSVDYFYRSTSHSQSLPDFTDNFIGIGARGEFTEKVSGEYHIGYTQRHFGKGGGNKGLPGLSSNFTYKYSPKTNVQIGIANDFDNAATGISQKVLSGTLGVQTQFEEGFSGSVNATYRDIKYNTGEHDHYWSFNVGLQEQYNKYLTFAAGYTYQNNGSNLPVGFTDNMFQVSGTVRY